MFTSSRNTIFTNLGEFIMMSTTEDLVAVARSEVVIFSEQLCFCVGTLLPVSQPSSARMSTSRALSKALANSLPMPSPDSKLLHTPHPMPLQPLLLLKSKNLMHGISQKLCGEVIVIKNWPKRSFCPVHFSGMA